MNPIGKRSERRAKSGFGKLGKWVVVLLFIGAIGFTGYKVALSYVSDKLMDRFTEQFMDDGQIEQLANDPNIRKIIENHADLFDAETIENLGLSVPAVSGQTASPASENQAVQPDNQETERKTDIEIETEIETETELKKETETETPPAKLAVTNREEATKLLLTKFSVKELTDIADMAKNGLDPGELQTIQSKLLNQLTEEEFESIKIVALMEVMKQKK